MAFAKKYGWDQYADLHMGALPGGYVLVAVEKADPTTYYKVPLETANLVFRALEDAQESENQDAIDDNRDADHQFLRANEAMKACNTTKE
jgi:glycosyltransferase A (GT-A) superfamily protein (DUF2064 family)